MNSHFVDPLRAVHLAVRAEAAGYDSFWNTDFVLGPHPDSMALLAAASQETERITLGTAVMVLPYRNPVLFAKVGSYRGCTIERATDFGARRREQQERIRRLGPRYPPTWEDDRREAGFTASTAFRGIGDPPGRISSLGRSKRRPRIYPKIPPSYMAGPALERRAGGSDSQEDRKAGRRVHTVLRAGLPIRRGA